jgi:alpha-galactosidase
MAGVPQGAVVETNAVFSRDSIKPIVSGELTPEVNNLVMRHVLNQETTLHAALNKDKEMAFRAFVNDPLVALSPEQARELFDRMLENTKAHLPGWDV